MPSASLGFLLLGGSAFAEPPIDANNWGSVTAPVFGTSESGDYAGAELFAGPRKFGDNYYHGVLPNGRIVRPAGTSIQIGMDPLGAALTPDGKYLITSNDDERKEALNSVQNPLLSGGYSLSVVDTATMRVVSHLASGPVFIGLQVTGAGPYTVWASGGPSNSVKRYTLSTEGKIAVAADTPEIPILPLLPADKGYVSHYLPGDVFNKPDANGNLPPVPSAFEPTNGAQITFPAGSALSPDGKFLYVACNGDNSLAVINTTTLKVVKQVAVGYFPYSVSVSQDGGTILVSNWGVTEYKFAKPFYDAAGKLTTLGTTGANLPDGFYVPVTSAKGANPQTSSLSVLSASGGDGAQATLRGSIYQGKPLDALYQVGDTHPSATAIIRKGSTEVLYVTKSNSDSLGLIRLGDNRKLRDFDLAPVKLKLRDGHQVHGAYPNALAVSTDNRRLYVALAGLNSVAVLDTTDPTRPVLLGYIPTGWYPAALSISRDPGSQADTLYVVNAKGIGEDINPRTVNNPLATGVESFQDSNFVFGSVQKINLAAVTPDKQVALANNLAIHPAADTSIVPVGGKSSKKIKHVFFILHENKSFDSMLGSLRDHFGPFASLLYNNADGTAYTNVQNTGVVPNLQLLASTFAAAANYYSDSEESDAGHLFASSGTATDYSEKTLLVKTGRGLLVNKNMEPEDYPEGGYIFNNAARNGVSFKDYGDLIRITGTDTGTNKPTTLSDSPSGKAGYPQLQPDGKHVTNPVVSKGDIDSLTQGLGQSYFLSLPILAILGDKNANGEPHLDHNYPGYNFNISDQRRALEFCKDFDRMLQQGTLPQFCYIYLPNDHGGGVQAPNAKEIGTVFLQQVADGDVALGMVVDHILKSPIYYDAKTGDGSALFITFDDAQASLDHIHPHRTPLVVVSPYAKVQEKGALNKGYIGKKHYVTASIVKTEELLLGLPPNNYGDLFATDLRDLFQSEYNGITADMLTGKFTRTGAYKPSPEGEKIWALVSALDIATPDRDSRRLGRLARLSAEADRLHAEAAKQRAIETKAYQEAQERLYETAKRLVQFPAPRDDDD